MDEILEKLKDGVRQFRSEVHAENEETYRRVALDPQRPHTLVIACADSRVDVETITSSGPGEIFVMRNIGNMVPSYAEFVGSVTAVIEYAVAGLNVRHIVICGHSDCGAMKALLNPVSTANMPTVKRWLQNAEAALRVAETIPTDTHQDTLRTLTEQNVLMHLAHLKMHPSVAGALARRSLTVSGWIYDIGTGEIRIAEDGSLDFLPF